MSQPDATARATRFYALLVRLYPRTHRAAFGVQMLQTFKDHYREESGRRGLSGFIFWLAVIGDAMKGIATEHIAGIRSRRILPILLMIGAAALFMSSFLWLPGYILSVKIPAFLLLMIGFVVQRSRRPTTVPQHTPEHVWARYGVRCGSVLGLLWVALNLAVNLSGNDSSLRTTAKMLDVGILLFAMPVLFVLAGFISGRRGGTIKDGALAGLLGAVIGAVIMAVSLVAIMLLFWDSVRANAFQSAEMIRAWHASGDQSFGRYLWGDTLSGAFAMTIVSLIFGGLLGTLGGALGAFLPRKENGAGLARTGPTGGIE